MALFVKGQPRPPGSGRKKGQPNRATIRRRLDEAETAEARLRPLKAEMPLDFLLRKMRDPATSPGE